MRIAHLAVGDRSFYVSPDEADQLLAAAAIARESGSWLNIRDASGRHFQVLIPTQMLLVFQEYEVEDVDAEHQPNDWASFDYDF